MEEKIAVLNYNEVIKRINNQTNHLLIGNGFNYGLGINTSYKSIFNKMIENDRGVYKEAMSIVENCNHDLELFMGELEKDIDPKNVFLRKYIRNKIKFDFMKAAHEIVKTGIKNIYAEKNEGIFLLFQNFTNFFSLNYDSCLYLLLLKYKPINYEPNNVIAFEPSIRFIGEDMNKQQNNIYTEIKEARRTGKLKITFGNESDSLEKALNKLTKTHFQTEVNAYSKANNKGWKAKDIKKVVNLVIEEEKRNYFLKNIDDGSRQLSLFSNEREFIFDVNNITQNVFFLHGAFHIYKDRHDIKKITQDSDKALYEKLEEILNNEEQDIVCVFQQENKIDEINQNEYLLNCYTKLGSLTGNMVIIGSSLADNDDHIFKQINDSGIETVFISSLMREIEKNFELAKRRFPSKKIYLFDAETISYEVPGEKNIKNQ
jgi:hypothetical protein